MGSSVKILFARDDLSTNLQQPGQGASPSELEKQFSAVIADTAPDAIVIDFARVDDVRTGVEIISRIRRISALPLVVVTPSGSDVVRTYRFHGASECITPPVDIGAFGTLVQQLVELSREHQAPVQDRAVPRLISDGLSFDPRRNLVSGPHTKNVRLTTAEARLLQCFSERPWSLLTRQALSEILYGRHRPVNDRAVDVIVNRLRNKLVQSCGLIGRALIKTEFGFGYTWVPDGASHSSLGEPNGGLSAQDGPAQRHREALAGSAAPAAARIGS